MPSSKSSFSAGGASRSELRTDPLSRLDFKNCVPKSSVEDLSPVLVERLLHVQRLCGFPLVITSAYRSQEYERSKGRKGTSSHCRRLAVDVSCIDSHTRFKVLFACLYADIPRIGVGRRFLHLDIDETKAHPIIFHYYDPQNT